MARELSLADTDAVRALLTRAFQSAHVSFLLGSGASAPAIPIAGPVEKEIGKLFADGDEDAATRRLCQFLATVQEPTNALIARADRPEINETAANYEELIGVVDRLLSERRSALTPAQATVFTTNYDLFMEFACSRQAGVLLNDGFVRGPVLDGRSEFSARAFFNAVYTVGDVYRYRVEVPCINLIKLHGSMSWEKSDDAVTCTFAARDIPSADSDLASIAQYLRQCAVVLPHVTKHRTSVMEQTYYDLFRIYANLLDKENSVLVAFGFSFSDEHILHVTRRALRNPTLLLVVFAFDRPTAQSIGERFKAFNNVTIVTNGDQPLDFPTFNRTLSACVPAAGQ